MPSSKHRTEHTEGTPTLSHTVFIHSPLPAPFPTPIPPSLPPPPPDQDEDFDSAGGLLGSSMKRVKNMAKAGHNRWMCYLILFIVAVFFMCYYIIKWRSS